MPLKAARNISKSSFMFQVLPVGGIKEKTIAVSGEFVYN